MGLMRCRFRGVIRESDILQIENKTFVGACDDYCKTRRRARTYGRLKADCVVRLPASALICTCLRVRPSRGSRDSQRINFHEANMALQDVWRLDSHQFRAIFRPLAL
jgi:hypothetical protein